MLFILILLSAPVAAGADGLINQELFSRIVPEEHLLEGKAVLTLVDQRADWPAEFRLAAQADIGAVTVDDKPVPFTFRQRAPADLNEERCGDPDHCLSHPL